MTVEGTATDHNAGDSRRRPAVAFSAGGGGGGRSPELPDSVTATVVSAVAVWSSSGEFQFQTGGKAMKINQAISSAILVVLLGRVLINSPALSAFGQTGH